MSTLDRSREVRGQHAVLGDLVCLDDVSVSEIRRVEESRSWIGEEGSRKNKGRECRKWTARSDSKDEMKVSTAL